MEIRITQNWAIGINRYVIAAVIFILLIGANFYYSRGSLDTSIEEADRLEKAILEKNLDQIRKILTAKPQEAWKPLGISSTPPILVAAEWDFPEVMELLLEKGAPINQKGGKTKCTALSVAAFRGNIHVMQTLIDHGAKVDEPDLQGETPLMDAVRAGRIQAVKLLLKSGADPCQKTRFGKTAFSFVSNDSEMEDLMKNAAKSKCP